MATRFKYARGQRLFQVDTYLDSSSDVTILTKINGKSVLGVIPALSMKLISDSFRTISSFTVHQKCFAKFVTSLKEKRREGKNKY